MPGFGIFPGFLSLCVLFIARLRGLGRYMEVETWFGQIFKYSGDILTSNSIAGGGGNLCLCSVLCFKAADFLGDLGKSLST